MTIQYQGVWSLQNAAQLQSTQRWVTDPLFENTTLLLQADDAANGAQNNTFLDSSSNSFAITRNGGNPGMTQGSFTPFSSQPGAWSNYFNGATTSGPFVSTTYSTTNFDWFTSGQDFTLEYWIFPVDLSTFSYLDPTNTVPRTVGNNNQADSTSYWNFGPIADGRVRLHYFNGGVVQVTSTATVVANTWNHVAFTKTSSGITIFVNGVASTTTAISGTPQSSTGTALTIGRGNGGSINGYISNIRILKNVTPPYSGAYTIPVLPLTAITGTRILTAQANQFVDVSSIANTMSASGATVSVQPFSPFAPQFQWTPSVIGGSGYFDGTTDTLTAANNAAFQFGTGDFEVSGWVYPTSYASVRGFFSNGVASNGTLFSNLTTAGRFESWIYGDAVQTPTINVPLNAWTHLTISRVGTAFRTFVNGVQDISYTTSRDISAQGCIVGDAFTNGGFLFQGYISSFRVRKGSGVSSVIVPTAPSTAITNTSLLLNFTNAGIFDGTMKNNLETVGNAQISTAVVKYGSGSMYFDGTSDYLTAPVNQNLAFGTGDFTLETWVNVVSLASQRTIVDFRAIDTNGANLFFAIKTDGTLFIYVSTADRITSSAGAIQVNNWYHVAVCRLNSVTRMFINGVQAGSNYADTTNYAVGNFRIGQSNFAASPETMNGYLDDFRITKGIARYTANFIPPSVALPRQ